VVVGPGDARLRAGRFRQVDESNNHAAIGPNLREAVETGNPRRLDGNPSRLDGNPSRLDGNARPLNGNARPLNEG